MLAEAFFQILTRLKSVCPLAMSLSRKYVLPNPSGCWQDSLTWDHVLEGPLFLLAIGWGALPTPPEYSQVFATWPSP